jgi:protein-serine/threonine kinase
VVLASSSRSTQHNKHLAIRIQGDWGLCHYRLVKPVPYLALLRIISRQPLDSTLIFRSRRPTVVKSSSHSHSDNRPRWFWLARAAIPQPATYLQNPTMAGPSSQALQPDPFVDHGSKHYASDTLPLLNAADASALEAAVGEANRRNLQSNQSINLSYANFHHNAPQSRQTDNTRDDPMSAKPPTRPGQLQFRSQTIAPSPPLPESSFEDGLELKNNPPSPLATNNKNPLHIATDVRSTPQPQIDSGTSYYGLSASSRSGGLTLQNKTSSSSLRPISRTPSFKQAIANSIGSACSSAVPSPIISAMGELTPLPSPLLINDSPGPWRKLGPRPPSRESAHHSMMPDSALVTMSGESVSSVLANQSRRKAYAGLKGVEVADNSNGEKAHGRNRSVSEYVPDSMSIPKRLATVSGSHPRGGEASLNGAADQHMRREPHLSAARGLVPTTKPPTPPPSESSQSNDGSSGQESSKKSKIEYFEAHGRNDNKLRRWRAMRLLGEGTFSRVMLATSQVNVDEDESTESSTGSEPDLKTLVAVKVCEHGPRGGASETRIEMSLKRELEIMQSVRHPSLVHLKAWNIEPTRALLVLSYCPGGDLFDVATRHKKLLTPPLLRRIFAELVGAVRYLHERRIVHRDIKLESR